VRSAAAIIEAAIDVDLCAEQIIVALAGERDADGSAARHEQLGQAARATQRMRRLEIGAALLKARGAWPISGPKAKGWSEFLARVKLDDSTAVRYMHEARTGKVHGEQPDGDSAHRPPREPNLDRDSDDDTGPRITPLEQPGDLAPFRALTESDIVQALARLPADVQKRILRAGKANVTGGSGDVSRGKWCTPKALAEAVGPWDLDPFSSPRSHVAAVHRCMLEDGGDGFGGGGGYGRYRERSREIEEAEAHTRVWIQPPYELVLDAIQHYGHTRFGALLRWAPDTEWFARLWPLVHAVAFPIGARLEFEPPEGIEASSNPYPHALYYADDRDVTQEVCALCIVWRVEHTTTRP
jgi:hypothetical protein